jgi:hypothetical protein
MLRGIRLMSQKERLFRTLHICMQVTKIVAILMERSVVTKLLTH